MQYVNDNETPERQLTPEEYLGERKNAIRKRAFWAVGIGALVVGAHLGWLVLFSLAGWHPDFSILFRSVAFILGLFVFAGGVWGIYHARSLKIEDLIASPEAIEFARQTEAAPPYFTYLLVGLIVAVMLCQLSVGLDESREIAGLQKSDFWVRGEYWRILTGAALHGSILHIFFNGQALLGLGGLIEHLSNRAHLLIVFVLAIVGGSLCSLYFLPEGNSVGASGGVMGLFGYLAVYAFRRKRQLPPDFLKSLLINIGFIAAFGLIAYQIIDNFAHLGGFAAGAIYGLIQIPRDLQKNPRTVGAVTELFSYAALLIFVFTCIFSILLLLKVVQ
ncbi:MAG: rhomboid family intramembrane serine protease [Pyrinomonadaceae bacterium]|nr:rhomboid family intramembrane serine protease [Pyrinomonadaceae bacterium]